MAESAQGISPGSNGTGQCSADQVPGGERLLDYPKDIVRMGLELEHPAVLVDGLGFQNLVVLAATVNVRDDVA